MWGGGGPSFYLASLLPTVQFTVFDYSFELITEGRLTNDEFNQKNLAFQQGDIYALKRDFYGNSDGIISLQTLSWLPDFQEPLAAMMEIGVKFIAISSLFFEGNISTTTQVLEHKRSRTTFYNTYSMPQIDLFVREHGYFLERFQPFEIDVDIPKPENGDFMSTYTLNWMDTKR